MKGRINIKCILLSSILSLWSFHLSAQAFHFTLFGPKDGLNSPELTSLFQDSNGLLWIGTSIGLNVYDGYEFHSIDSKNGGPAGKINDIAEDPFGVIWIATETGLGFISNNQIYFLGKKEGLPNEKIDQLYLDVNGNLWIGSSQVLSFFSKKAMENFHRQNLPSPEWDHFYADLLGRQIFELTGDKEGNLYIGTFTSLVKFNRRAGFQLLASTSETSAMPTAIVPLGRDSLIWSIYDGNIYQYANGKLDTLFLSPFFLQESWNKGKLNNQLWGVSGGKIAQYNNGDLNAPILSFQALAETREILTADSTFWVAFSGGLVELKPDKMNIHFTPKEWNLKYITCMLQDREGNYWLGSSEGLVKLSPRKFTFHYSRDSIERDLYAMEEDDQGRLIIGGNQGRVYFYDNGPHYEAFEPFDVLPAGEIYDIHKDHKGHLWFVSYWKGVAHLKNGRINRYGCQVDPDHCLDLNYIYEDQQQNLWLGTWTGISRLVMDWQADTVRQIVHYGDLDNSLFIANSMIQDKFGTLWIGTNKGLYYFDPATDQARKFSLKDSLYSIAELKIDAENHLWIATQGKGIFKYKITGQRKLALSHQFSKANGLASDYFLSMELDDDDNGWGATFQGISFLKKSRAGYHIINYNAEDGLIDKAYHKLKLFKDSKGTMWGLSTMGLFSFAPKKIVQQQKILKTHIVRIDFSGVEIDRQDSSQSFKLPWNRNVLQIDFRALNLTNPSKIKYSWRLQGLENNWSMPGTTRSLRFNHLSPGKYTFQVKACNPNGFWNEEPTSFAFIIRRPWWSTWWAYLSYFFLTFSLAFTYYFYKKRQWQLKSQLDLEHREAERLKELDAVKSKIYTNITHEFRTPLTIILGIARQIKENPKDWFNEGLKMIERNGRNLLQLVNQMLDLSKLESSSMPTNYVQEDLIVYLKYVVESFHSLAENKNIQLYFQTTLPAMVVDYDPDKMLNIVSNLLSNAIKFTPEGGKVYINLEYARPVAEHLSPQAATSPSQYIINIKDTGIGISPEKLPYIFDRFYQIEDAPLGKAAGTGIGLALTKELVKLLNGKITVTSQAGLGTEFSVFLPISPLKTTGEKGFLVQGSHNMTDRAEKTSMKQSQYDKVLSPLNQEIAGASTHYQTPIDTAGAASPILLLVEDNKDVVLYLKSLLDKDYQIKVAVNGKAGMDKAIQLVPDVIITDVMMPIMDGLELCDRLKKDMRTSHIPIIMLTAKADMTSKIEGLKRGADAYLSKPFNKEELLVRLQMLWALRKRLRARYGKLSPLTPSTDVTIKTEDAFIAKLQDVLETHYNNENFGIPELCRALFMSRSQLYRKVSALTGMPAGSYIRSFRLMKARHLLQTTSMTVSEIAFQTGFKHLSHFSIAFRKEFGENPSDLRT